LGVLIAVVGVAWKAGGATSALIVFTVVALLLIVSTILKHSWRCTTLEALGYVLLGIIAAPVLFVIIAIAVGMGWDETQNTGRRGRRRSRAGSNRSSKPRPPIPVESTCSSCGGSGNGSMACLYCGGRGNDGSFTCIHCKGRGVDTCHACGGCGRIRS
jgi:hypothetical protein